jgi:CRP-like cAMP-binding protein
MSTAAAKHVPVAGNRLLDIVDAEVRQRLLDAAELVPLTHRQIVADIDRPIEHVYFPLHGVLSVLSATTTGEAVETATVGPEGMTGIPVLLGADQMSCQTFCQVPGRAYRLPAAAFRAEVARSDELRGLLGRYAVSFIAQTSQTSACNRLHSMRERCARWLLQTHDRVNGGTFALTQDFLAQMMGVRRATVSEVASGLQRDGLIEYSYRQITVLDRVGLEAAACECYRIITAEYDRLVLGRNVPSYFSPDLTQEAPGTSALQPPTRTVEDVDRT